MDGRKVAAGCGITAVIGAGVVLLVLGLLALLAGWFLVRSSNGGVAGDVDVDEAGQVEHEYSAVLEGVDGSTTELWASPSANCIGVTTNAEEAGTCRGDGPVIDEIVVGSQLWYVVLAEVGVTVEPTDYNCLQTHGDILADHNLSWCQLS